MKVATHVLPPLLFVLLVSGTIWFRSALSREYWRVASRQVMADRVAMLSLGVLSIFLLVTTNTTFSPLA